MFAQDGQAQQITLTIQVYCGYLVLEYNLNQFVTGKIRLNQYDPPHQQYNTYPNILQLVQPKLSETLIINSDVWRWRLLARVLLLLLDVLLWNTAEMWQIKFPQHMQQLKTCPDSSLF